MPFLEAMCRGSKPSLLALLASAPWDSRKATTSSCSFLQASYRAEALSLACVLMSAPGERAGPE